MGDGGTWKREWDSVNAYATLASLTPCKGCHGATLADFTFGTTHNATDGQTEHSYNWDNDGNGAELLNAATHSGCKVCHGANSATDYITTPSAYVPGANFWRGVDGTSMHGDGSIQMNGPAPATGTGYDSTNWGCANARACHENDWTGTYPTGSGHRLDDSNWNLSMVNFGGASCTSCHGYPPTTTGHVGGTFTNVDHSKLRAGGNTTNADVTVVHGECDYCHGVRDNGTMDGFTAVIRPRSAGRTPTFRAPTTRTARSR